MPSSNGERIAPSADAVASPASLYKQHKRGACHRTCGPLIGDGQLVMQQPSIGADETMGRPLSPLIRREKELAAVQINKDDIGVIAGEYEIGTKEAELRLRECGGDLAETLKSFLTTC